jgi:hypothetical protein
MTSVNALYKEYIEKMPKVVETKKEIGVYEKEFWKANKEKVKELKVKAKADAKASAKANTKAGKRKAAVDEEGNVKVRAPTAYNIFVKEYRPIVKEARPDLDNKQIFSEIARLWKVKKEGGELVVKDKTEEVEEEADDNLSDINEDDDEEEDEDDDDEEEDDEEEEEEEEEEEVEEKKDDKKKKK